MPNDTTTLPRILAFDVFGTVVDWHGSIVREVDALGLGVDAVVFARDWRAGYKPAMARVMSGELGWMRIDALHRIILEEVLSKHGVTSLDDTAKDDLNRAWHRLDPWPDTVAALTRLKTRFMLCTLSNGNIGLLADMAKRAGLPWDCVLSAEVFHKYKPDPGTYLGVADVFDAAPNDVMLVAAHQSDLDAARDCGLRCAYIERIDEFGADAPKDISGDARNNFHARDLADLADQLNC
ncbi:haloacid dehalogenase type II [Salinisphaera aquimarina]|uniref:(S)-2-haloacid dehalogenase n=1 Tax=Salinisphaera aquimarina TaxID=2094031 RepID=A0ABV7ENV6_9GAMM